VRRGLEVLIFLRGSSCAMTHLCFWTVLPSFRDIDYLAYITNLVFTGYYFFLMLFGCFT